MPGLEFRSDGGRGAERQERCRSRDRSQAKGRRGGKEAGGGWMGGEGPRSKGWLGGKGRL